MEFGVVLMSVVPVRRQPSDKAEMTTQLLFGELVVVHQKSGQWLQVRNVYDNYEGWVDVKQVEAIDEQEFNRLKNADKRYLHEVVDVIENESDGGLLPVVLGTVISGIENKRFTIAAKTFSYSGELIPPPEHATFANLLAVALLFLNAPYFWGGKTPFGADCSGFIQTIFTLSGIHMLRDSSQQATLGEPVSLIAEAKPGDLAFFDDELGNIIHVGMIIENNQIIHASGKVHIDAIDHQGIYNREQKAYTHSLRTIRRIL